MAFVPRLSSVVRLALALTSILTETDWVGLGHSAVLSAPALPKSRHLSVSSLSRLHALFSFYHPETVLRTVGGNSCHCSSESGSEQWRVIGLLQCGFV